MTPQRLHAELLEELMDMSKTYLLGVMHDSTERKNTYRISSKENKYIQFLADMIHKMGHNAWTYREGKTREMYVVEFSKKVVNNTCYCKRTAKD